MPIEKIEKKELNLLLNELNYELAKWNQVILSDGCESFSVLEQAPSDSRELYCFSFAIIEWILGSGSGVLKFDVGASLTKDESFNIYQNIHGLDSVASSCKLFDLYIKFDCIEDYMKLADIFFHMMLSQNHGTFIAFKPNNFRRIVFHDGFVYLVCKSKKELASASELLKKYASTPSCLPEWLLIESE